MQNSALKEVFLLVEGRYHTHQILFHINFSRETEAFSAPDALYFTLYPPSHPDHPKAISPPGDAARRGASFSATPHDLICLSSNRVHREREREKGPRESKQDQDPQTHTRFLSYYVYYILRSVDILRRAVLSNMYYIVV